MKIHEHCLLIALEDLNSAKHLFSESFVTTLFHVQQCAEKALKAFLIFENTGLIKTHDLVTLVDQCHQHNKQFEMIRPLAAVISPYSTAGRYPDNTFKKPSQEKIQSFIEQSEAIFNFVKQEICKIDKNKS